MICDEVCGFFFFACSITKNRPCALGEEWNASFRVKFMRMIDAVGMYLQW